jgi:SAM-dependent methyltransferase
MRNFHNIVKRHLIKYEKVPTDDVIYDMACGKAGDIAKITDAGYTRIFMIDISKEAIQEAEKRVKDIKNTQIIVSNGDVTKPLKEMGLSTIDQTRINKGLYWKADRIIVNFAIHYMADTRQHWNQFISNVTESLSSGKLFCGTILDGEKLLEKKSLSWSKSSTQFYGIKFVKDIKFNPDIKTADEYWSSDLSKCVIDVERVGWTNSLKEPLLFRRYFSLMVSDASKGLLEEVSIKSFSDLYAESYELSESEKDISFSHYTFIFRKK